MVPRKMANSGMKITKEAEELCLCSLLYASDFDPNLSTSHLLLLAYLLPTQRDISRQVLQEFAIASLFLDPVEFQRQWVH